MAGYGITQKRVNERGRLVLAAIDGLCQNPPFSENGVLLSEAKAMVLHQNKGYKVSVDSMRDTFEDLEIGGKIYQANPPKKTHRRYLPIDFIN